MKRAIMAEEEVIEEQPTANNSGGKKLMIVLVGLIIVLLLAVVGGGFFLYSQGVFSGAQDTNGQTVAQEEEEVTQTFKVAINDLVLNITNAKGREKLMKLSFSLKSNEPSIESLVEELRAEIIDVVISQISARSSEELLTVGGQALLKEELLDEINSVINESIGTNTEIEKNSVKKIYFTSFVIK